MDVHPVPDKDPQEGTPGEEPMTGPQASYLNTLAQEAGVDVPDRLTKADASRMIDDLQNRTGRGSPTGPCGGATTCPCRAAAAARVSGRRPLNLPLRLEQ